MLWCLLATKYSTSHFLGLYEIKKTLQSSLVKCFSTVFSLHQWSFLYHQNPQKCKRDNFARFTQNRHQTTLSPGGSQQRVGDLGGRVGRGARRGLVAIIAGNIVSEGMKLVVGTC